MAYEITSILWPHSPKSSMSFVPRSIWKSSYDEVVLHGFQVEEYIDEKVDEVVVEVLVLEVLVDDAGVVLG